MIPEIVKGDLLEQNVEVIVNPWNQNIFPWWLLLPQGVSGAIKKKGGLQPFRELRKFGYLPLGTAVETTAGKLRYHSIIHVAGINLCWYATRYSIQKSVENAMLIIQNKQYTSAAFPLIGSGSGNRSQEKSLEYMLQSFANINSQAKIFIVKFAKESEF